MLPPCDWSNTKRGRETGLKIGRKVSRQSALKRKMDKNRKKKGKGNKETFDMEKRKKQKKNDKEVN